MRIGLFTTAQETFDEFGHETAKHDSCETYHNQRCTFDDWYFITILFVTLYSQNEGKGNRPPDRSGDRHDREFIIGNGPFLFVEKFEQHRQAKNGSESRNHANQQLQCDKSERYDFGSQIVDGWNTQIDKDYCFRDEGYRLKSNSA